jgi:predicted phosphodiesterase
MAIEFENDKDNIFYYTDNIELLKKSKCSIYIHGHVHQNFNYKKDGINILCNPFGYPEEEIINSIKQFQI